VLWLRSLSVSVCHKCARKGHIAVVCLSKQCKDKKDTDQQKTQNKNAESIQTIYNVFSLIKFEGNKTGIEVELFNTIVSFQMGSAATVSVLNVNTYKKLNSPRLQKCDRILHAFGQQQIPVLGELNTVAKCDNKLENVVIIMANVESSNNLFGLDLLKTFNFEIQQIANVTEKQGTQMTDLCQRYKEVFEPAIGMQAFTLNQIPYQSSTKAGKFRLPN